MRKAEARATTGFQANPLFFEFNAAAKKCKTFLCAH
jgi:hypothetical protein